MLRSRREGTRDGADCTLARAVSTSLADVPSLLLAGGAS